MAHAVKPTQGRYNYPNIREKIGPASDTPWSYGGGGPCNHSHLAPRAIHSSTCGDAPAALQAGSWRRARM